MLICESIAQLKQALIDLADLEPPTGTSSNEAFIFASLYRRAGFRYLVQAQLAAMDMGDHADNMNKHADRDEELLKHADLFNKARNKAKKYITKGSKAARECHEFWALGLWELGGTQVGGMNERA